MGDLRSNISSRWWDTCHLINTKEEVAHNHDPLSNRHQRMSSYFIVTEVILVSRQQRQNCSAFEHARFESGNSDIRTCISCRTSVSTGKQSAAVCTALCIVCAPQPTPVILSRLWMNLDVVRISNLIY
jgi:hypothetical protein